MWLLFLTEQNQKKSESIFLLAFPPVSQIVILLISLEAGVSSLLSTIIDDVQYSRALDVPKQLIFKAAVAAP